MEDKTYLEIKDLSGLGQDLTVGTSRFAKSEADLPPAPAGTKWQKTGVTDIEQGDNYELVAVAGAAPAGASPKPKSNTMLYVGAALAVGGAAYLLFGRKRTA